jgi:hypothetical protein
VADLRALWARRDVIAPLLMLDSQEKWWPVDVEESLRRLGYEWDAGAWQRDGRPGELDFPAQLEQPPLPAVGYHRVARAGGLDWHQFWTWWLYNPKKYAGTGAHEGDWEMVQLGCAGDRPILMTCSQHSGGEKREFWRVSLADGQPLVYVARDSHANYFAATRDVTDVADGKGTRLEVEWREFGSWAEWPGRWGHSDSSPGPLSSRRAWKAPHAYHGQARG